MSKSISTTLTQSLETMPHNTLVIDRYGSILYANSSWIAHISEYGLSTAGDWVGMNYFDLLTELISDVHQRTVLQESLQGILRGERLVFSEEYPFRSPRLGGRLFRIDACPMLADPFSARCALVISCHDVGPVIEGRHLQPIRPTVSRDKQHSFLPICASCKSIRNSKEEWVTIERFLQHRLSVQLTHDICPECIRLLYPKYAGALKGNSLT
ncbi:hypothetical protein GCM10010912_64460 [Paenibacillus albidus]|uniref:PAS domain-containing protein n=1 Tax=Paenibacillus albidus TaxID=2041023 RepID=A0A917FUY8_9BACL|nr:hypothetical protein [Paenibacillus albidus]GGG11161.1 hypothetical protein GCM10010912_64460 [Paenibacillus albidus]